MLASLKTARPLLYLVHRSFDCQLNWCWVTIYFLRCCSSTFAQKPGTGCFTLIGGTQHQHHFDIWCLCTNLIGLLNITDCFYYSKIRLQSTPNVLLMIGRGDNQLTQFYKSLLFKKIKVIIAGLILFLVVIDLNTKIVQKNTARKYF